MQIQFSRHLIQKLEFSRRNITGNMVLETIEYYDLIKPAGSANRLLYLKYYEKLDKFLLVVVENNMCAITAYLISKGRVL
ncbi:MAG: hypothetical protein AABX01_02890 [Candidatus Micrarchaeota archaeon]